ncbi:hypothetical protein [Dictyobacter vulcani]|uniref:hypothetical protein n=1 Tax=Dictyobacter vulcani TaxID=2607529 RepID=UPI0013870854|nr:hypothetical protein [Dictyobacter vulcani]
MKRITPSFLSEAPWKVGSALAADWLPSRPIGCPRGRLVALAADWLPSRPIGCPR